MPLRDGRGTAGKLATVWGWGCRRGLRSIGNTPLSICDLSAGVQGQSSRRGAAEQRYQSLLQDWTLLKNKTP